MTDYTWLPDAWNRNTFGEESPLKRVGRYLVSVSPSQAASGSGSLALVRTGEQNLIYLVTNKHVVHSPDPTDTDPDTQPYTDLGVYHWGSNDSWAQRQYQLRGPGGPLYKLHTADPHPDHPTEGIDLAVLQLGPAADFTGLQTFHLRGPGGGLEQGDRLRAVGFPGLTSFSAAGPEWSQRWALSVDATVASPPEEDWGNEPLFLAVASTRPGMSGSLVVAFDNHPRNRKFDPVGVMSGILLMPGDSATDYVRIWKWSAVEQIIREDLKDHLAEIIPLKHLAVPVE